MFSINLQENLKRKIKMKHIKIFGEKGIKDEILWFHIKIFGEKGIKDEILWNKSIVFDHYNCFSKKMTTFEFASGGWGGGWM